MFKKSKSVAVGEHKEKTGQALLILETEFSEKLSNNKVTIFSSCSKLLIISKATHLFYSKSASNNLVVSVHL